MASRRSRIARTGRVASRDTGLRGACRRASRSSREHAPQGRSRSSRAGPFASLACSATKSCSFAPGILVEVQDATIPGRRQIVALRFPGEGILPREGIAEYGIQAIVRSEVMVGKAEDFDPIVDAHPEMQRFFRRLIQRNEAIGYEWLVNCGRAIPRLVSLTCCAKPRSACTSGEGHDGQPVHAAADRGDHRARRRSTSTACSQTWSGKA